MRITAVAAGPRGLVAIGYDETGPGSHGAIWYSGQGQRWERVGNDDDLSGVLLADVAAGEDGFVAVGNEGLGPTAVIVESRDGAVWHRAPVRPEFAEFHVSSVASQRSEIVVVGLDDSGTPVSLRRRSAGWQRLSAEAMGLSTGAEITKVATSPDGWIGAGSHRVGDTAVAAVFRSVDGTNWLSTSLNNDAVDGNRPGGALDVAVGRWAMIAQGTQVPPCGIAILNDCSPVAASWWSGDGEAWAHLPTNTTALGDGSVVASAGELGFVAIGANAAAWVSAHGLEWKQLDGIGDVGTFNDVEVRGNVVVVVGERDPLGNGLSAGFIITGVGEE